MRCTLWSTLSKTIGNCANTWIQRSLNWFSPWDNRFYTVKPMPAGNIHFIHQLKVIYWKLPNNLLFSVSKFISLHFFINLAKPSNRPLFAVLNTDKRYHQFAKSVILKAFPRWGCWDSFLSIDVLKPHCVPSNVGPFPGWLRTAGMQKFFSVLENSKYKVFLFNLLQGSIHLQMQITFHKSFAL